MSEWRDREREREGGEREGGEREREEGTEDEDVRGRSSFSNLFPISEPSGFFLFMQNRVVSMAYRDHS